MQLMSSFATIDRRPDYNWMDRTDYTRPDFNLYTNSRSTESINKSTGSMLNNNNQNNNNNNNISTTNQSSIVNAADVWCSDKFDSTGYQLLFSPDSTKSSNSPSGLNLSDLTEESFIYETACDTNQPVKYSQDYEDFGFHDEINQISKLKEYNDFDQAALKVEHDAEEFESVNSLTTTAVLYQDTMITGLSPPTMLLDEDTYLVTVNNFDDLIIKPESKKIDEANASNANVVFDYMLTPAPSPKSPASNNRTNCNDIDDCENSSDCTPVNDMIKASSPAVDRLLEHNYNLINPYNNRTPETRSCKRKLVTDSSSTRQQDKRTRRVHSLKLTIPKMRMLRQNSSKIEVSTPDITNTILEMENSVHLQQNNNNNKIVNTPDIANYIMAMEVDKFDLVDFITSSQDKNLTEHTIDLIDLKQSTTKPPTTVRPPTPLDLEAIINEQCPPTALKRRRTDSYDNPGSVQSFTSTIQSDDSHPPAKRRGRPPKSQCTLPSPSAYKDLSESDMKYMAMRNKNNEASRRSRINRKDREHQIESEARQLENEHKLLAEEEKVLIKQVAKWRQAVMKLAQY